MADPAVPSASPAPPRSAAPEPVPVIGRRGLMLVLSSPSGAGKTSISRRLLELDPAIRLSISATTRPQRPGEQEGVHYFFVSEEEFARRVAAGAFLEHALVFGRRYGTPRDFVERCLDRGEDVLFDIDWQGTQQLREAAPADLVSVFVLPPSMAELRRRLASRAQDSAAEVASRMARAGDEMSHWPEYDYVLVNREFEASVEAMRAILAAERLRRGRQRGLAEFVAGLRAEAGG